MTFETLLFFISGGGFLVGLFAAALLLGSPRRDRTANRFLAMGWVRWLMHVIYGLYGSYVLVLIFVIHRSALPGRARELDGHPCLKDRPCAVFRSQRERRLSRHEPKHCLHAVSEFHAYMCAVRQFRSGQHRVRDAVRTVLPVPEDHGGNRKFLIRTRPASRPTPRLQPGLLAACQQ